MPHDWRAVAADPRFHDLVRRRRRLTWSLTAVILVVYFGFILAVAFAKPLLARPIGAGVTSIGVVVAIAVILLGIALTALYVRHANRYYDAALRDLREGAE